MKPEGIPDDIWQAAWRAMGYAKPPRTLTPIVRATDIARALLAERIKEQKRASRLAFDGEEPYRLPRDTADYMAGYLLGRIHASQAIAPEEWSEALPAQARP